MGNGANHIFGGTNLRLGFLKVRLARTAAVTLTSTAGFFFFFFLLFSWLVAERPSNMLMYLRDGSAQTI